MRTKVKLSQASAALSRLLNALETELIASSDEEIVQAAQDLGMNPFMQGSAAFMGLKFPVQPRLQDFFDFDADSNLSRTSRSDLRLLRDDADD